ncbi:MAG: 5-formyltetrahydrofolate cyclo-ligase [Tannerellaceae bacterium]|nr:5-formyltetrahydrofolate cyclo-ligase [Tannerellaceae bacterium]
MDTKDFKKQLRKEISIQKKRLSPESLFSLSRQALRQLENSPLFRQAKCIALYHALPDEIQTGEFIEKWYREKTILLPVIEGNDICFYPYTGKESTQTGTYGICEPCRESCGNLPAIDLAIIPGIAFDRMGNRLGRGKGYYDRFLTTATVPKVGLCFDFQLMDTIPTEPFDIPVNLIITPTEIITLLS